MQTCGSVLVLLFDGSMQNKVKLPKFGSETKQRLNSGKWNKKQKLWMNNMKQNLAKNSNFQREVKGKFVLKAKWSKISQKMTNCMGIKGKIFVEQIFLKRNEAKLAKKWVDLFR